MEQKIVDAVDVEIQPGDLLYHVHTWTYGLAVGLAKRRARVLWYHGTVTCPPPHLVIVCNHCWNSTHRKIQQLRRVADLEGVQTNRESRPPVTEETEEAPNTQEPNITLIWTPVEDKNI